jgi:fatty-acyl-CoA synthase
MNVSNNENSSRMPGSEPALGIARIRLTTDEDRDEIEKQAPLSLFPASNIYDCIVSAANASPQKEAIILLDSADTERHSSLTYAQLHDQIAKASSLFVEAVDGRIPIVTVIAPLHPEVLIATWAAETVGIVNPINPFLDLAATTTLMTSAESNVLVIGTSAFGSGIWDRLEELRKSVPTLRKIFVVGEANQPESLASAIAAQPAEKFAGLRRRAGDEPSTYMPTGGTTSTPKIVIQTQERQLLNAWLMGALMGVDEDEVVGLGMPLFHVGGLVATALRAIIFGQTLVFLTVDGFRNPVVVKEFWPIMKRYGVTNIIATPTTAAAILAMSGKGDHSGNFIRTFCCGGSTIPVELLSAFYQRFGIYLREVWGMTEFHGVSTGHPNDGQEPAIGSVGRRFAFHEVKVVELDELENFVRELPSGEKGILVVKSFCVGSGYLDRSRNASFFVEGMPDGGVWASTGDIGSMDSDGHIWVHGRQKDLIVRGGHNIDPKQIEEALQLHPAVQLSAAIGRPDAKRGEMPIAYVQLKPEASVTRDELLSFAQENIAERAAAPIDIIIIPAIPLTAVGKIAKPALRLAALDAVAREVAEEIAGNGSVDSLEIDTSGKRPLVRIIISQTQNDDVAALSQRLNEAFMTFEFSVEIRIG